ncbi:hypothetical protein C1H46_035232 [Malus baccata]|uniref:MADS-box domain-containing protein n=1 Tax=Malus baccata TaxID=106549 RepID=A0A540KY85_MALBA|nr:hypothetical protein C1H46_035232 [Malus baccata]
MVAMTIPQARNIGLPFMNLVRLQGIPILQQLHLEEQLLRTSSENWCIINDGTNDPAIVMGVSGSKHVDDVVVICPRYECHAWSIVDLFSKLHDSGYVHSLRKPAELLEIDLVLRDQIPVIRRFTGGGTVAVDQNTLFVTFICNKDAVPGLQPYPRPIMSWSSLVYSKVFEGLADFQLRENDYVFGNRKFGGNAQSISKNRWIHHTSFLWDYEVRNMAYLKHPKRVPEYRLARDHLEFICRMKDYIPRSVFLEKTVEAIGTQFSVRPELSDTIEATSNTKFVPSTRLLTRQELEEAAAFHSQAERNLSQSLSLMGRVKLKIKKLESSGNRQVTFSKRRNGILKKAKELSILCDVDIVLLMFSPTGRPTLFQGERSNIEEIISKFAQLTPQERAKRKLESLEVLKKTFKKLDHDVNVQEFMSSSSQTVQDLTHQVMVLQAQLTELHRRLSLWSDPDKVDNLEQLRQMEDMLKESINRTRLHKFQNGMPSSFLVGGSQEAQPITWLFNSDNQHMILPNEQNYLPHSTSSSTGKQSEAGDPLQLDTMGQISNMEGGGGFNEFDINACLSTESGEHYAYPTYCSSNVPDDKKVKPENEMNVPANPVDYQLSSNFELPRSLYENDHHAWLSSPGPSGIAVYKENTYQPVSIPSIDVFHYVLASL